MPLVKQLILASASPFRRSLLAASGLAFMVETAPIDERGVQDRDPRSLARRRAEAKAVAVARASPGALVIGADQVLSCDGQSFDKAENAADASVRLRALSGRTHMLHSAFTLVWGVPAATDEPQTLCSRVVDVAMPMRVLTAEDIAAYVATKEWQGSVGCYQYENRGVHLFAGVASDQSTIIGLPMQELLAELRELGIDGLRQAAPPWTLRSP